MVYLSAFLVLGFKISFRLQQKNPVFCQTQMLYSIGKGRELYVNRISPSLTLVKLHLEHVCISASFNLCVCDYLQRFINNNIIFFKLHITPIWVKYNTCIKKNKKKHTHTHTHTHTNIIYIMVNVGEIFDRRGPYRLKSSDCFMKVQTTDKRSEVGLSM